MEVRSPSTAWVDEGRKREIFEDAGVAAYWLADPAAPSITIPELVDGRYAEVACAIGNQVVTVGAPVAMTLNPAVLARG